LTLPDLTSRLGWGPVFQLATLSDRDKRAALQMRARRRGLELGNEVAEYLLRRYPRDMDSLFSLLNQLDRASLVAQRRLTIPFVRELLG
jgi:DnaA family protein